MHREFSAGCSDHSYLKLNLITRYIIPVVDQHDITGEGEDQFGLSDATINGFFSPIDRKKWVDLGSRSGIFSSDRHE